jgi:ATP-dependent helicase/DNAse subunit B
MKKIFTMCLGLVLTAAVFAADRKPDVTIVTLKKYEIVIDGRTYFSNGRMMNIENLRNGRHSIQVYETSNSFSFFKKKRLVASKTFQLRNDDLKITIDRFGHMTIAEDKFGRRDNKFGKDDKDWNDRDRNDRDDNDRNRNDRDRNDRDRKF